VSLARNTAKLLLAALRSVPRGAAVVVVGAAIGLPLAACGRDEADLSNGKGLFTQNCGTCHELGRAGTQGKTGPSLDMAFRAALAAGESRETVEGIVHRQILHPRKNSVMPPGLVKGDDARDVAAYVSFAAARPGQDQGALAQAGLAGAKTGEQIFTAGGCAGCHQLSKAGANGNIGPSLNDLAEAARGLGQGPPQQYVQKSILDPDAYVVKGFPRGVMPSFEGKLTDKQVKALVSYLLGR
jgi:mono/diheme cytochrome c family protein